MELHPMTGERGDHDVERLAARRRGWAALELVEVSEEAWLTILAHRADLALTGLVCGWPYPKLVDVELHS